MTESNPAYHKKFLKFLKKLEVNRSKVVNLSDKPKAVKTHMRDLVVVPKMIGSVVNVHTGKAFATVDIKNNMIGYYFLTYFSDKNIWAGSNEFRSGWR